MFSWLWLVLCLWLVRCSSSCFLFWLLGCMFLLCSLVVLLCLVFRCLVCLYVLFFHLVLCSMYRYVAWFRRGCLLCSVCVEFVLFLLLCLLVLWWCLYFVFWIVLFDLVFCSFCFHRLRLCFVCGWFLVGVVCMLLCMIRLLLGGVSIVLPLILTAILVVPVTCWFVFLSFIVILMVMLSRVCGVCGVIVIVACAVFCGIVVVVVVFLAL